MGGKRDAVALCAGFRQRAQAAVGRDTARQHYLRWFQLDGGGEQFFDQYLGDRLLKAGGDIRDRRAPAFFRFAQVMPQRGLQAAEAEINCRAARRGEIHRAPVALLPEPVDDRPAGIA